MISVKVKILQFALRTYLAEELVSDYSVTINLEDIIFLSVVTLAI